MNTRLLPIALIAAACSAPAAMGQGLGYSITGGLSNFDCTNRCDTPCDEFEIEIEGAAATDVYHTYHNGNYGAPNITDVPGAVRIDYHNPQHRTAVGTIEHFGVSLRNFNPLNPIRVRWLRNGQPATVNGSVPVAGGSAQNSQPKMPSITTESVHRLNDSDYVIANVTNNDPTQAIWIQRRARITSGEVLLEALMPNDPVVTGSITIDPAPRMLGAGQTLVYNEDLVELEDRQSVVFSAAYFQNATGSGPFGQQYNILGPQLGNVMTASVANRNLCVEGAPFTVHNPVGVSDNLGELVTMTYDVEYADLTPIFQWRKDGVPISDSLYITGTNTSTLTILHLNAQTAGTYYAIATNDCGTVTSDAAQVRIVGDTGGGGGPNPCMADFNTDDLVNPDDLSDYINGFFDAPANPRCDMNGDGLVNPDDLSDYINAFFDGCA